MPAEITIHRTKLENADELYERHAGDMLTPPRTDQLGSFPELTPHEFTIKDDKTDIVFSGLGWVTVNEGNKKVTAYAPKGVNVTLRSSLI